jgi:hypothetical protein
MFPDIVQVDVTKQQGVDARVTLVHRAGCAEIVFAPGIGLARRVSIRGCSPTFAASHRS